jgi:hypothetical protein
MQAKEKEEEVSDSSDSFKGPNISCGSCSDKKQWRAIVKRNSFDTMPDSTWEEYCKFMSEKFDDFESDAVERFDLAPPDACFYIAPPKEEEEDEEEEDEWLTVYANLQGAFADDPERPLWQVAGGGPDVCFSQVGKTVFKHVRSWGTEFNQTVFRRNAEIWLRNPGGNGMELKVVSLEEQEQEEEEEEEESVSSEEPRDNA